MELAPVIAVLERIAHDGDVAHRAFGVRVVAVAEDVALGIDQHEHARGRQAQAGGDFLRRFRASAKGRASRIMKPTCHIFVTVGDKGA